MNKSKKIIIAFIAVLTAIALFLIGVMSFFIAGSDKFADTIDKRKDAFKTVVFEKEYNINDFKKLKIDVGCADVIFKSSENENVSVTVFGAKDNKFSGEIKNDTLELNEIYGRATLNWKSLKKALKFNGLHIVVKIPQTFNCPVDIDANVGDIEFQTEYNSSLSVQISSGDFEAVSLKGKFDISTDTGDISIKNAKPFENSSLKTDTGDIEVDNISNTKIISEADTGDEDINGSDDNSSVTLNVSTDTGDIEINDN